jgi:acyl homoserine lactone synthase
MPPVVVGALHQPHFRERYALQMYQLRYRVFHERLRWDVKARDGEEVDVFDDMDSVYLLTETAEGRVTGGWRLRPTTRPYMLSDVFPQLLHGVPVPQHKNIWEISRFAVDVSREYGPSFGFGDTSRLLVTETIRFAADHQINQYVMVVSVAVERLLRGFGLKLHRFGPPVRLGKVLSVAVWLDIDSHTRHVALGDWMPLLKAA